MGTVIADNPLLTDRSELPRRRPLLRVIVDSHLRLPLASRIVQTAKNDVLVFCSFAEEKKAAIAGPGIQVEQVASAGPDGRPELQAICRRLAEREITSVMIEGGAMVNWAALASRTADKVFFLLFTEDFGRHRIGAVCRRAGLSENERSHPQLKWLRLQRFGEDFAVEGYLRDPYLD